MIKEKQKERKQKAKEIVWFIQNNINSTEKCINFADDYIKKALQDGEIKERERIKTSLNDLSTWCLNEDTNDFWDINDVLTVVETPEIHKAIMKEKELKS